MTDAPKTCMVSRIRITASTPSNGARRTPAREAKAQPSIQLQVVIRRESRPSSSVRLGSSTTARVWTPRRV
jgi:hypothetical protein